MCLRNTVNLIFECFLDGMSLNEISAKLYSQGISSPSGKDTWSRKVLSSTLSNEKYYFYGIVSLTMFESAQTGKSQRAVKKVDSDDAQVQNKMVDISDEGEVCVISSYTAKEQSTETYGKVAFGLCAKYKLNILKGLRLIDKYIEQLAGLCSAKAMRKTAKYIDYATILC